MDAKRRRLTHWTLAWACAWVFAIPCLGQTEPAPHAPSEAEKAFTHDEGHWYGLDSPRSIDYQLDELYAPHTAMFKVPLIDNPINSLLDLQRRLNDETGLRTGMAYTQLYQQATGGSGDRWGTSGDVDLFFDWTLVGRGTGNAGRFFFSIEDRFRFGSEATPAELTGQIGSGVGTGGPFNDRGFVIRDAFWDQRLFDDRLRVLVGRAAPDDYVGSHRLGSANFAFFNGAIGGNPTMAFVGHGPMALVSTHPTDDFYATVGAANAYSVTPHANFDTLFDEWQIYGFGEIGVTPQFTEQLGRARYALTAWNMPGRELQGLPSDWGFSVTAEQYLTENLWVYARYGHADKGVLTGVQDAWAAALAIDGLLGSPDNLTGIGFGYTKPSNDSLRDQKSVEVFHRFQVTEHTQFTVGAQAIFDPSNKPHDDVVGVFSLRLRIDL